MSEHLKRVWLCHLSEENNHPELARKTVESVLRSYGIVVGADLQLEVLKRNSPTGLRIGIINFILKKYVSTKIMALA